VLEAPVGTAVQVGELAVPLAAGVPDRLPPRPAPFLGRERELLRIVRAVEGPARAVLVTGGPGSGRSATAVEAAHRLAPLFPDGRLAESLADRPLPVVELAERVLAGLRLPADEDPVRAAREVLARRRVLLLLDDAADARVLDLLTPDSPAFVLLTGRTGLGPPRVRLRALEPATAAALLGGEPPADRRSPLALRTAAAHRGDPDAARLVAHAVRGSVARAVAALDPLSRTVLRSLGAVPFPAVDAANAAALAGVTQEAAAKALAVLADADLVERRAAGRCVPHPQVRWFVEADLRDRGGARAARGPAERVARHYGRTVELADRAWFAAEWPNLAVLATDLAARGALDLLDHLADAVADRVRTAAPRAGWLEVQQTALRHARTGARRGALGARIGEAHREWGESGEALRILRAAEADLRAAGASVLAADAARAGADALRDLGEPDAAAAAYHRVLAELRHRTGRDALVVTAWTLAGLGTLTDGCRAARLHRAARDRFRTAGHREGEAAAEQTLAAALRAGGDLDGALAAYRRARALHESDGRPVPVATLLGLGETLVGLGRTAEEGAERLRP
jgi:tetratricopeptide (TPR) repeat protein